MLKFFNLLAIILIVVPFSISAQEMDSPTEVMMNDILSIDSSLLSHDCPICNFNKKSNESGDVNVYYNDQSPIANTDAFLSRDVEYGQAKVKLYDYQGPIANTWFVICTQCGNSYHWAIYYVLTNNDGILTNDDGNTTLTLSTREYGFNELSRTFYYPDLSYV